MNEAMKISTGEIRVDKYSVEHILDNMCFGKIVNHERNRDTGQWQSAKKTKLIDSILRKYAITPIMVIQKGTGSGAVLEIIDGGQRLSTIEDFKNNVFKLGKVKPIWIETPKMADKLDENGNVVKELLPGHKHYTSVKVYALDDNGKPILEKKQFNLSNKYYKDLPQELQKAFMRYDNIVMINMVNYSEEEAREQMLRFNMHVSMNPAQAGVIACEEKVAKFVKGFRQHNLFKNCSTWTSNEIIKDAIERCITEAYILMYMPNSWGSYPHNVELFNTTITDNYFDDISEIVDKFAEVINNNDIIIDNLCSKNMYIVLANFKNFYEQGKYKLSSYADFLCSWFSKTMKETDYVVLDKTSTKTKCFVLGRLEIMNNEMQKYMQCYGVEIDTDEDNDKDNISIKSTSTEDITTDMEIFCDLAPLMSHEIISRLSDKTSEDIRDFVIKSLMVTSTIENYHLENLNDNGVKEFIKLFNSCSMEERDNQIEYTNIYFDCLDDYLMNISSDNNFITNENLLCLLNVIKNAQDNDVPDDVIENWIVEVAGKNQNYTEAEPTNKDNSNIIIEKMSCMNESMINYYNLQPTNIKKESE